MKLMIRESAEFDFDKKSNLTFVKLQPDQYDIILDEESVGTIWCRSYYSQPKNRVWNVNIEFDSFSENETANSVADAKNVAKKLWKKVIDRAKRWQDAMKDGDEW